VYYIIEEQLATSTKRICVALFDFDPNLTSTRVQRLCLSDIMKPKRAVVSQKRGFRELRGLREVGFACFGVLR
jgi:hypothetical protein